MVLILPMQTAPNQDHRRQIDLPNLTLITSSNAKVNEVVGVVGNNAIINRIDASLEEYQPSKHMDDLRLRGSQHYLEIAQISILKKFDLLSNSKEFDMKPGYVLMDTAWFQLAQQGLPGICAASSFHTSKESGEPASLGGRYPITVCNCSKMFNDYRVVWVESIVIATRDTNTGELVAHCMQSYADCYTPLTPEGVGWAFDTCTCVHPIILAESRGLTTEALELSKITNIELELPLAAHKLGLLQSFASLDETGERQKFSPRTHLFNGLLEAIGDKRIIL